MVSFDHVWLRYAEGGGRGVVALRDLSFDIPEGGFRWLCGPSGAGKSSVLRVMTLAAQPSEGHISVLGMNPGRASRRNLALLRRRIGVVYQDFRLLAHLSAFENVALPLRLARRKDKQINADVTEILTWVGLGGKLTALPNALSGGEQQRIAIARAIVAKPQLLVADEPTGNLDDEQAQRLMSLLVALNRMGTTIVIATHNLGLMEQFPAPKIVLAHGELASDEEGVAHGAFIR